MPLSCNLANSPSPALCYFGHWSEPQHWWAVDGKLKASTLQWGETRQCPRFLFIERTREAGWDAAFVYISSLSCFVEPAFVGISSSSPYFTISCCTWNENNTFMSMKKNVGILKSKELVIQKQFLHEKKKKKTEKFCWCYMVFQLEPSPPRHRCSSLQYSLCCTTCPESHLLIRFQLTTMNQWLSKARFHLASLPGSIYCCLVEDNS